MSDRCLILIFDMLAGHWDESIIVPATGLQPPNVEGYVRAGLLPVFQECMNQGLFARAWNRGSCITPYAQKYLASGTYRVRCEHGANAYWKMTEGADTPTLPTACKLAFPEGKVAAFGSDAWMQSGWWKAQDCTMGWGSYFSDYLTSQHAFHWMLANPDWKMVVVYLAQYDTTGNCPLYLKDAPYTKDKHHSLLQLDRYLWMVKTFLEESGWWDESYLFVTSDHGCHYGCNVSVGEGRKRGIREEDLANYCSNHQEPWDCYAWDFARNEATGRRLDCARRTFTLATGGALPARYRGTSIDNSEIIDLAPTVAQALSFDLRTDGRSLL